MQKTIDNRRVRSEMTKSALMRAAEKLIAEVGVENVSIREIVAAAGQKNESALQYHFKNLTGLLNAIHIERSQQVQEKRAELLNTAHAETPDLSLRQLCSLMVEPSFQLARRSVDFRRYVKAFGHELALTDASPLDVATQHGGGGRSGKQIGQMIKDVLPNLDDQDYGDRMDAAVILCSASMYRQARRKNAFRGKQSDLFLHSLIDALVGLLSASVSSETRALK
ncbi:MAG: TetR family transcriptional regulator [Pseudomonadales bacterium]|nr:TetR family transcriptional regulator [Pseudomonadales bacterium]